MSGLFLFTTMAKTTGIELIALERKEQIEKHGWDIEHDKCYKNDELLQAAEFCIDPESPVHSWPEEWLQWYADNIKQKPRIEQLRIAGAFIAAEIDRLLSEQHD